MSTTPDLEKAMDAARRAADAGAEAAMRYFRADLRADRKADGSLVTEADHAAERAILDVLTGAFPEHSVFTEESGAHAGDPNHRWIVDPVDGTHRFARGMTYWGSLIALQSHGRVVAAAMAMPVVRQTWWAAADQGCWRNDQRVNVSGRDEWADANLSLGSLARLLDTPQRDGVLNLVRSCDYTIAGGDLNGCALVLSGCAEAWIESGVQTWDIAPFRIMVEEAGGRFTNFTGEDTIEDGAAVATNGVLHDHVLTVLNAG